jgi:hypothetical protein
MSDAELVQRVEHLKRDNRRLKGLGLAFVVLAAALALTSETHSVPPVITAQEFRLVDGAGRTRGVWFVNAASAQPDLALYDEFGRLRAQIGLESSGSPNIDFLDAQGNPLGRSTTSVNLKMGLDPLGFPALQLSDPQGFRMDLGSTNTVMVPTGERHETSAASIVMFGNDKEHKVIWKAP